MTCRHHDRPEDAPRECYACALERRLAAGGVRPGTFVEHVCTACGQRFARRKPYGAPRHGCCSRCYQRSYDRLRKAGRAAEIPTMAAAEFIAVGRESRPNLGRAGAHGRAPA